ncbi:hypothetical protein AAH991_12345 [Microbispora sp. ZYX-F-249]|uniref:Ig-like domain-containing protein n=1 Tax=Microbispora maris TaxID=3144104 RepID=A0ABV0AKR0_9ACTN
MNALVTRVSTICAAVALAGAVTAAPAAAQNFSAHYTCAAGNVLPTIDWLTGVLARDCTGPGASDGAMGSITIPIGTYSCRFVYYSPESDYLSGYDCY